jgi:hypothetical protein
MNIGGGHCSERVAEEQLRKEETIDNWCRLLGTSSLNEGAV